MKVDKPHRKSKIPENAKCVFEGMLFNVYQWEQELFDGTKATFEKLIREDSAIMLPVLEDGRILLIEDEQPGEVKHLVFPAGRVDPGEYPEAAARRELLEETGYAPESVELVLTIAPERKIDWELYYYVGRNCKKVQEPLVQAGERITLHPVTFEEMLHLAATGKLESRAFRAVALEAMSSPDKMQELKNKLGI